MALKSDLERILLEIDGQSYGEYKRIKNKFDYGEFSLQIDCVQGDPFAAPSLVRIFTKKEVTLFDDWFFEVESRSIALRDFLCRRFSEVCRKFHKSVGSGHSGVIGIDPPGQELISRSAVLFHEDRTCEVRFTVGLPANGRRILGKAAAEIFNLSIPYLFYESIPASALNLSDLRYHAEVNEDATYLRKELSKRGLVGFIADGSFLPRSSGIEDTPLERARGVEFESPPELREEFTLPHRGKISGLAVREGITLITGGGFHGKSTLLRALENGVYNHIPGDGREFVVCISDAVKIRAEDGRSVAGVDISTFINNLPSGVDTQFFSTTNASGSTSQAANIVENIELGCKVILIDEDTSATNFMVRDRRMQELIEDVDEPITPLLDQIREMRQNLGISMIAVIGGNGDYLDIADNVIGMKNYMPFSLTAKSKVICRKFPSIRKTRDPSKKGNVISRRNINFEGLSPSQGKRSTYIKVRTTKEMLYGDHVIVTSLCEQFVHPSQLRAIGWALRKMHSETNGLTDLVSAIKEIEKFVGQRGVERLTEEPLGDLSHFRKYELAQVINRIRDLSQCVSIKI